MATTNDVLAWVKDDGGRSKYFKAEKVGDCVTRSIAIASGRDYKDVYDELFALAKSSPRDGVSRNVIRKYMAAHGYEWVSTMKVGQGVTNHLRKGEVPMQGAIICNCSRHLVAVIDGVVHDTYDPARDGGRAVYGYWIVKPAGGTPDGDKPEEPKQYKPITDLPTQFVIKEWHKIAGGISQRERTYVLKTRGNAYYYECNGKMYHLSGGNTKQQAFSALLNTLNMLFEKMHHFNINYKEFGHYAYLCTYA